MKRVISVLLAVCLCLGICGVAAFGEDAAEMTGEELYQAGMDARDAGNYAEAAQ